MESFSKKKPHAYSNESAPGKKSTCSLISTNNQMKDIFNGQLEQALRGTVANSFQTTLLAIRGIKSFTMTVADKAPSTLSDHLRLTIIPLT